MVTLILTFDVRSGQVQVKKVKLKKTCLYCPVLSQVSKNVLCFVDDTSKKEFQKSDVISLTCFLGHCTAKNKDIGLKSVHLLLAHSSLICIPFFGYCQNLISWAFIFEKSNFLFLGMKNKNFENLR